jgi:hypothetical protein
MEAGQLKSMVNLCSKPRKKSPGIPQKTFLRIVTFPLYVLSLCYCVPIGAFAQMAPPGDQSTRDQVKMVASYYVAALSCMSPQDVVIPDSFVVHLGQTQSIPGKDGQDVWAVLFTSEFCSGGNGNPPTYVAIVRKDEYDDGYSVDPAQSSPVVTFDEPVQQVDHVISEKPDTLTLVGHDYGSNDSPAQATDPATATMRADHSGNWSVVKQSP